MDVAAMSPWRGVFDERVRSDRADTILPAAVIVSRVALAAGAKAIEAPGVGIRDGILAEPAAESARQRPRSPAARLSA